MHVVVVGRRVVPGRLRHAPSCATNPWCTTIARPITGRSGPSSWATSRTVPPPRVKSRSAPANASWLTASTPAVGSSRISSSGRPARARAMSVRCCCPPERVLTGSFARSARPTARSASATASRSPRPGGAGFPAGDHLGDGGRHALPAPRRWGTYPTRCHWRNRRTGRPKRVTVPALSGTSPRMARIRVDLPEPLAPRSATTSPAVTVSETSRSTGGRRSRPPRA